VWGGIQRQRFPPTSHQVWDVSPQRVRGLLAIAEVGQKRSEISLSPRVIMEPEQVTAAVSNAAHHHKFSDLAAITQHDSVGSATASIRPAIRAGVETAFANTGIYAPRLHAAAT